MRRDVQAALAKLEVFNCGQDARVAPQRRRWTQPSRGGQSPNSEGGGGLGSGSRQDLNTTTAAAIPGAVFGAVRRAREANLEPGQTLSPSELPAKSFFLEWRNAQVDDKSAGGVG